jgi:two-component system, NarL family, nitrate/nitrite response regulator NarL
MHILLVDDHTLFREALLHVLNQLNSHIVVHEAANVEEAVHLLSRTRNLDLVLLDIDLPGVDGLTALPGLRELAPTVSVVVLSGSETIQHVKQALDGGAVGYIPKSCSSHEMLSALTIVLEGDAYVPPKFWGKLDHAAGSCLTTINDNTATEGLLTARQLDVLALMARGLPNKSIANTLQVTEGTVKLHVVGILRALGARNRTQAVTEAARLGLLTSKD